jgi:hypothetical protein
MGGRGSGARPVSVEEHLLRGTFRADRHVRPTAAAPAVISAADRRRALGGLEPAARAVAARMLDAYGDWTEPGLVALRAFARTAARLERLHAEGGDAAEIRREERLLLGLMKALRDTEAAR